MEEPKRRFQLRAVLALVAVASVAAVIWAASALASGGGSSPSENVPVDSSPAATVQNEGSYPEHDCPNRDSGFAPSSDV
jgi:hypothetical protein